MAGPLPTATVTSAGAPGTLDVDDRARRQAALAGLAFASAAATGVAGAQQSRHLAFLPPETLDLDLSNPAHRDFGDYELTEKLGQGGMGVVYRAQQKSLDREVALKLLAAGPWASAEFIERFRREAQSAARMQHPNIVPIFEIGAHDELNFFSMALVRGPTLAQLVAQRGPYEPRAAAQLVRAIAEAVHYAHRLGVLHLDLKPGNVLIDERGVPLVADFGLARRIDDTIRTDDDQISGTPSYMAPEQAQVRSHKLSPATDIYGLGAILYELLTGRPPFLAATPMETLKRVIGSEVERPHQLRHAIPLDLEAVTLKCLEKDPRARYASAQALVEDLGRFIEGREVSVRSLHMGQHALRWARREPRVAAAAAAFVFALIAGLIATAVQWRRADANAVDARDNLWVARASVAQSVLAAGDGFRGLRPLVRNLVEMEAAGRSADAAVERQRIGTILANAPRLIEQIHLPGLSVESLAISPDRQRFAIATRTSIGGQAIHQYQVAGLRKLWTTPTTDVHAGAVPHGQLLYSPDGSRLVVQGWDFNATAAPPSTHAILLDTGDGRVLAPPDPGPDFADIVYSGDGRRALVRYRTDPAALHPDAGRYYETAGWRPLGPRLAHHGISEWLHSPDGRWLLGTGTCCRLTLFEPATLEPRWHLDLAADDPVRAWRFSPDGAWLALGTFRGRVHLVKVADGTHGPLMLAPVGMLRWLEFSVDASSLAALDENGGISVFDVATRAPRATPIQARGGWSGIGRVRLVADSLHAVVGSQLQFWDLALPAPFDNLAVPGSARISSRRLIPELAFDLDPESRLLVAGGSDGTLSAWQMPRRILLRARAAPLPAQALLFDGRHVVAVEDRSVQLLDAVTQAPLSPLLLHPDPVQIAELGFGGRSLATVAGRTLRVFDPATGALRADPIVLPGTPLDVDVARRAPVLAVTTLHYEGDSPYQRIHVVDLDSGRLRTHAPRVSGLVQEFELDPLGRFAIALPHAAESTSRAEFVDLTGVGRQCMSLQSEEPDADLGGYRALADDGRTGWFTFGLPERRSRLMRWDLERCQVLASVVVPTIGTFPTLLALGDGVIAHRLVNDKLVLFDAAGRRREVPGLSLDETVAVAALSGDGHRIALAGRNSVTLFDLQRGERLSARLAAPIAGNDVIVLLAFSPDATRLLGRTIRGRWLLWHLPVATQDAATLATLAQMLDPDGTTAAPDLADATLRAWQPGIDAVEPGPPAARNWPAVPIAAMPGTAPEPRFVPLDLSAAINVPLNGAWPPMQWNGGDMVTLAPGLQRLDGIDWRVDGGVQLSSGVGYAAEIHALKRASAPIPVPGVRARRAHALMFSDVLLRAEAPPQRTAVVVLIGADGQETPLEILTRRDIATHSQPGLAMPGARVGWIGAWVAPIRLGWGGFSGYQTRSHVYSVSLDVPADAGPVHGVRLELGGAPLEAPLFYAVTLERADSGAPAPRAHGD